MANLNELIRGEVIRIMQEAMYPQDYRELREWLETSLSEDEERIFKQHVRAGDLQGAAQHLLQIASDELEYWDEDDLIDYFRIMYFSGASQDELQQQPTHQTMG